MNKVLLLVVIFALVSILCVSVLATETQALPPGKGAGKPVCDECPAFSYPKGWYNVAKKGVGWAK